MVGMNHTCLSLRFEGKAFATIRVADHLIAGGPGAVAFPLKSVCALCSAIPRSLR